MKGAIQGELHAAGLSNVTGGALPESAPTHIIIEDMSPSPGAAGTSQQLSANLHDLPESALICQVWESSSPVVQPYYLCSPSLSPPSISISLSLSFI